MDWLGLSIASLVSAIALHATMRRVVRGIGAVPAYLITGSAAGAGLVAICAVRYGIGVRSAASILVYALGCELYIFLFTMVSSSISASILLTLRRESMSESELAVALKGEQMVARRFERLVQTQLLRYADGQYTITDKGLGLIRTFRRLQSFFRHAGRLPSN